MYKYGIKGVVVLAFLVVLGMTSGCAGMAPQKYGTNISTEEMASFVKGKTTEESLLLKYGNPTQTIKLHDHTKKISYVGEVITPGNGITSGTVDKKVETWFLVSHGIIEDFGQKDTDKNPNYGLQ